MKAFISLIYLIIKKNVIIRTKKVISFLKKMKLFLSHFSYLTLNKLNIFYYLNIL